MQRSPTTTSAPVSMTRRAAIRRAAGAGTSLLAAQSWSSARARATPATAGMSQATPVSGGAPTVVLVHGAWADGASWAEVITRLQAEGIGAVAPANPLRGLTTDAAYLAGVVAGIPGPVLLVGHSYGGAVVTNAASQAANVGGLVFVAAFIPDAGESIEALAGQATDSQLGPALRPADYAAGAAGETGTELYLDRASYQAVFCADLPADRAAIMAATQRPAAVEAFGEPTVAAAWKSLPSWAVVATADQAIGVAGSRLMAQRAGADTVEVDASHAVMLSQPQAVIDQIHAALDAIG